jgi:hypothetical protein
MNILIPSDNYPEKYWLKYDHKHSIDHLEFISAKKLPKNIERPTFTLKGSVSLNAVRKYDYLYSDGPDVISTRLADWLTDLCPTDVQLIPATVFINGEEFEDYFIINILGREEAFDMTECVYVPLIKSLPDGPKKFKSIKLLDKNPSQEIFRATESNSHIIVADRVVTALQKNSVVGVQFVSKLNGI